VSVPRENNFNMIRLVLACLVIFGHAPELMDGNRSREPLTALFGTLSLGEFAVDGFFVLSGYLISQSWLSKPSVFGFLKNRVLRIYPGFIACVLLVVFLDLCVIKVGDPSKFVWFDLLRGLCTLHVRGVPPVFAGSHYPAANGPLWSIPYEFRCYLVVLLLGFFQLLRNRRLIAFILLGACTLHMVHFLGLVHSSWSLPLRCFMCFMFGVYYRCYRDTIPWSASAVVVALALLMLGMSVNEVAEASICLFGGYVLIWLAERAPAFQAFNKLPDVSYGVYLYAWPINKALLWFWPAISLEASMLLVLFGALVAGCLSWYLVEKPALRLK
jgi:peptidoglycan/LPS O-acetylase OafA/YrhL